MEKYLVVFDQLIRGNHGFYLVTYPHPNEEALSEVEGSITVNPNGINITLLEPGTLLFISGLTRKVRGWRAKKVWIPSPFELREHQAENKKT